MGNEYVLSGSIPPIDHEEIRRIYERIAELKKDDANKKEVDGLYNQIARSFMPYVGYVLSLSRLPFSDEALADGQLYLTRAIMSYDPSMAKLSTYVFSCISRGYSNDYRKKCVAEKRLAKLKQCRLNAQPAFDERIEASRAVVVREAIKHAGLTPVELKVIEAFYFKKDTKQSIAASMGFSSNKHLNDTLAAANAKIKKAIEQRNTLPIEDLYDIGI